jgi:hypothetical protein
MVIIIFARTNGYLDSYEVAEAQPALEDLLRRAKAANPTVDYSSTPVPAEFLDSIKKAEINI